ncbi:hypothetical protein FB451DRAFT_429902 [Mycena latifolia]|nr:hypothetical protein FB451DRAFT_429902 [Mycena latifolia]
MDGPPQLRLSALTWSGHPTTVCGDDEDEFIGTYAEAATVLLNVVGSSAELGTIEYTPATTTSFVYERHAYTSVMSSTVTYYGGAAALGENMSPLIRVCLPDRRPWPERFKKYIHNEEIERPLIGPPFKFWSIDWPGYGDGHRRWEPNALEWHAVALSPDLPGQPQDDVEPGSTEGRETDSTEGLGWQGEWAESLLQKQARNEPLGERTEIIWNSKQNPTWGVQVRLQPVRVVEREDSEYEMSPDVAAEVTPGISDYEVRATVLRVFIKSEEIARLREPEVEDEEEDSDNEYEEHSLD